MAYKNSELLSLDEKYKLGKYEFSIKTQDIPQTQLKDVIVSATGPAGKMGAKTIQEPKSTEIDGWYVDANSTTADVYVACTTHEGGNEHTSDLDTYPIEQPVISCDEAIVHYASADGWGPFTGIFTYSGAKIAAIQVNGSSTSMVYASEVPTTASFKSEYHREGEHHVPSGGESSVDVNTPYTYEGKTVYYAYINGMGQTREIVTPHNDAISDTGARHFGEIAWTIIYGSSSGGTSATGDILVGRFAIDIRVAGGTAGNGGAEPGPDGQPWQDVDDGQPTLWPGDEGYPDPEDPDYPGDDEPYYPPSKTLYLEIDGALSGRHNDPLNDTSYSYLPADKSTVKPYGYGGDGGHGGGGGGGASTAIVYKFATDKADYKEVTVKPKRHGYGSGGGKGGKGGDGCILIYY